MNNAENECLARLYSIVGRLEFAVGGERRLADGTGRMYWPRRSVYFFREEGERRSDTGSGPRIVRVGTHALESGSSTPDVAVNDFDGKSVGRTALTGSSHQIRNREVYELTRF